MTDQLVAIPAHERADFAGSTERIKGLAIAVHETLWASVNDKGWSRASQTELAADLGVDQGSISRAVRYGTDRGWYLNARRGYGTTRGKSIYIVADPADVDHDE